MEEGKRMFSIFAARMFEQRVLQAYREKVGPTSNSAFAEDLLPLELCYPTAHHSSLLHTRTLFSVPLLVYRRLVLMLTHASLP